jgi:hypothetical protein
MFSSYKNKSIIKRCVCTNTARKRVCLNKEEWFICGKYGKKMSNGPSEIFYFNNGSCYLKSRHLKRFFADGKLYSVVEYSSAKGKKQYTYLQ